MHRQSIKDYAPCFWVGGYGTQAIQVHLPSHTVGKTGIPLEALNDTIEVSHDYFCNRPAALRLWETIPEQHKVPKLLIADLDKRAGKTVNDTLALHQKKDLIQPGTRRLTSRGIPDPHEDTITIAHEFEGLSAIGLCENALSMGPDYVNIPEGKFCRMSDKTLWPTCDHQTKMGPKNDCFNVQSRQLIVGGKVTRGKPYNKEINFPLED